MKNSLSKKDLKATKILKKFVKSFDKKSKKSKKPTNVRYIMLVNGVVMAKTLPNKKAIAESARAIILNAITKTNKMPKIEIAEITSSVAIDLPVEFENTKKTETTFNNEEKGE